MQHLNSFYCLLLVICRNFNQRFAKVILKHQSMNTRILLLAISVVALSSCSVYKSGQTPDDVYYSPAPARVQARANNNNNDDDSYVNVNQQKAGTNNNYQSYDQYQDSYRDDRFLRMSVGNPYYMNAYNGYGAFDWRY